MIVKVQVSSSSLDTEQKVLIYNQDETTRYQGVISPPVKKLMRGRLKAFFEAHLDDQQIVLDSEVPREEW